MHHLTIVNVFDIDIRWTWAWMNEVAALNSKIDEGAVVRPCLFHPHT